MNLTGLRPTGRLHLGHFFSVIEPALKDPKCEILIANLHANVSKSSEEANECTKELLQYFEYKRLVYQEDVFKYITFEIMTRLFSRGELERMVSYKSNPNADFDVYLYPLKMAVDVIDYDKVYIGKDQVQHMEFAKHMIERYNKHMSDSVRIPKAIVFPYSIRDIKNPELKMSKSYPDGCIFLSDSYEDIDKKIRKLNYASTEGEENLRTLCALFDVELSLSSAAKMKTELAASIYRRINDAKI